MKYVNSKIKNIVFSGLCLALCLVLPFLTGQIPQIGQMLCPMHLPVLLCGFICGWQYGLAVGAVAPILRSLIFTMPPMFPAAVSMAFEMAVYGAAVGILYKALPKKPVYLWISLIISMLAGRVVWGIVRFLIAGFSNTGFGFDAFLAGAFLDAIPGIIVQLILVPLIVMALKRTGFLGKDA